MAVLITQQVKQPRTQTKSADMTTDGTAVSNPCRTLTHKKITHLPLLSSKLQKNSNPPSSNGYRRTVSTVKEVQSKPTHPHNLPIKTCHSPKNIF
jgi:hypothetical protein